MKVSDSGLLGFNKEERIFSMELGETAPISGDIPQGQDL
jgi:hypothetical protein